MLRVIQYIVIIFFILSVAFFGVSSVKTSKYRDTDGPEIVMEEDSVVIGIDGTSEDILSGVRASDRKDGDVTDSLVVQGLSNFVEKGRRDAIIAAFDSDNNVTKVTREVIYEDYVSPRFSLDQPLRFNVSEMDDQANITSLLQVTDCLDGDLSSNIFVFMSDNFSWPGAPGEYGMIFQVTNSAGDVAELQVTVDVYDAAEDSSCPKAVLSDYLIYMKAGERINPLDYVEGIELRGTAYSLADLDIDGTGYTLNDIQVNNAVNTGEPGVYEIVYSMKGEDDYQSKVRLIVVVE